MASPFNIGQFADGVDRSIQKIVKLDAEIKPNLSKYYNFTGGITDRVYKQSTITGLSEAEFTAENGLIFEDTPIQGFDQSYTQRQIDDVVSFSYQVWKFAITKHNLQQISKDINRALNRKKERLAAERLINGFSTSYTHTGKGANESITITGGDALEPWSTAHTREDGGTNMNNVVYDGTTYSLPFDYAGYKAAMRTAGLMVDGRGNPDVPTLDTLWCKFNSSVHFKAQEILGAIKRGMIPESTDHDGAGVPAFKILPVEFSTQDAYWGMFDSSKALGSEEQGFQHFESEMNNVDPVVIVPKTREMQFVGHSLFVQGFNDVVRSWVFSAGDSTTS